MHSDGSEWLPGRGLRSLGSPLDQVAHDYDDLSARLASVFEELELFGQGAGPIEGSVERGKEHPSRGPLVAT